MGKNVLEQGLIDIALACEQAIGDDKKIDAQDILSMANEALRNHRAEQKVIEITEWIKKGEFNGDAKTSSEAIEEAGNILDGCESHEIFGENIFKGSDGHYYKLVVEGLIVPVDTEEADRIING